MRKKFKILYPKDHPVQSLRGTAYKPEGKEMVVMNGGGVFFLYTDETFYPYIQLLSEVLPKYDVVWG